MATTCTVHSSDNDWESHAEKELYQEPLSVLDSQDAEPTWQIFQQLKWDGHAIKEMMRLYSPIHSRMRKVKSPIPVGHNLLASPCAPSRDPEFFPDPLTWNPH